MDTRAIDLSTLPTEPIAHYDSVGAWASLIATGHGETRVHCLRFEPGGRIGTHPTGYGQLYLVIEGSGWAVGGDGRRVELSAGQAIFFARGEIHAKGSDVGMTALMLQVTDLEPSTSS